MREKSNPKFRFLLVLGLIFFCKVAYSKDNPYTQSQVNLYITKDLKSRPERFNLSMQLADSVANAPAFSGRSQKRDDGHDAKFICQSFNHSKTGSG